MNAPTAVNVPWATPNTVAPATTVLFATASVTPRTSAWTVSVPFATTQDTLLPTAPSQRTPVAGSSLMTEIQRDCDLVPVVQVFEGGIVMVRGLNIIFSIIHLSPLMPDSPFTFTVSVIFFTNTFRYTIQ